MKMVVSFKKEFGRERFYPLSEQSSLILRLMGRSSFTLEQVQDLKAHGWEIEVIYEKIEI